MKIHLVAILLFCFCAHTALAQVRPLTLNEAIAASLQNNYDIQLSRNDSLLATLNNSYARYAFFPRVNASGGILQNRTTQLQILKDTTRGGKVRTTNASASINLNWTLFDGFRMFITRRRLGELVALSELQIKAQVVNTVANVMRTYYDIVRQEQQLKAIEEQMALSGERLKLAQYRFDIGVGVKPDVLQARIDLNGQRSALLTQQTAIANLKETLNQLLVLPVGNQFVVADTSISFNTGLVLDSVRSGIGATNPDLLLAQQNLVIADLLLQERRAERYPTVEFNSAYNFNQTKNQNVINPITQPLLNRNAGLNYGLTATIPIFNGYATRRNIQAAQLDIQFQQLQYERSLATINTGLATSYANYDLSKRALALEEENIILVRENIFIARERYRLGVATFLEMRTAEQSLADAQFRLIQARFNTKVAEIELMRLRGDLVN
jgi:outer membrane protein TolC